MKGLESGVGLLLIAFPMLGGIVLYFLIRIAVLSKGRSLQSRFRNLGDQR
jgi:hypothetical protein